MLPTAPGTPSVGLRLTSLTDPRCCPETHHDAPPHSAWRELGQDLDVRAHRQGAVQRIDNAVDVMLRVLEGR